MIVNICQRNVAKRLSFTADRRSIFRAAWAVKVPIYWRRFHLFYDREVWKRVSWV